MNDWGTTVVIAGCSNDWPVACGAFRVVGGGKVFVSSSPERAIRRGSPEVSEPLHRPQLLNLDVKDATAYLCSLKDIPSHNLPAELSP
jgi:hypothetical protein